MNKITLTLSVLFLTFGVNQIRSQNIVINEILASNSTVNTDEDGEYQDWVEIFNKGAVPINLTGYGLTDDSTLPYKWIFPNISLAPGQYKLIWCSDKNRANPANPLHTNFKISASGEVITLTNASSVIEDSAPATATILNVSYGRLPNGTGGFSFFSSVTPSAQNATTGYNAVLNPPIFSRNAGFSTTAFNLTLATTDPTATIIYTTDGSDPNANNLTGTTYSYKNKYPEFSGQSTGPLLQNTFQTLTYSAPIAVFNRSPLPNKLAAISSTHNFNPDYIPQTPIFKGTVIRARVVKSGALPSKIITKTYFVTPAGASQFSLPVVSLSLSENKLFDYNNGIFVAGKDFDDWRTANPTIDTNPYNFDANYRRTGDPSERAGNINYFVNGTEVLNQDIGIRINGTSTRAWQSKSFRLLARSDYGNDSMNYKFFPDQSLTVFNRLVLRNSGSDFFNTMYRDALTQALVKDLGLETQDYQPTVTFVNGEYWGILNLREKYDQNYFKNVYNINTSELDMLQDDLTPAVGDGVNYNNMATFMENNSLSIQSNFNYVKTQMNTEDFRDYYISNIYFENVDWPGWNTVFWRKRTSSYLPTAPTGQDGRWRTGMNDTDSCFGLTLDVNDHDTLAFATEPNGPEYPNPPSSTLILRSLLANQAFSIEFINRFADLMNTYFLPSRVIGVSNAMKNLIAPEIDNHIARWSGFDHPWWEESVNIMHVFATERPAYQRAHIRQKFGISSNIDAVLNVSSASAGYIKMNTIDVKAGTPGIAASPYPWTGIYFSGIPVKLKAIAYPGFTFSHWTGASTSTNSEITITSAVNFSVTAVFIAETVASSHPIYYWTMNSAIPNDVPLQTLNTTYRAGSTDGVLQYQSSLAGYPFTSSSANWRKASMERRNSPTDINYIPEANANLPFVTSDIKGLQIKEPLQNNGLENTLVFNFSTTGFKDIKFSFAAINEQTNATNIILDYAINSGSPIWTTAGMPNSSFPLTSGYQLYNLNFSSIAAINNNAEFKVRIRFTGTNMTADTGARITFNNIAVHGTQLSLLVDEHSAIHFMVFPNPFTDIIFIKGSNQLVNYQLFTIDGKLIKKDSVENSKITLNDLSTGIYLLQLSSEGKTETIKIIKK